MDMRGTRIAETGAVVFEVIENEWRIRGVYVFLKYFNVFKVLQGFFQRDMRAREVRGRPDSQQTQQIAATNERSYDSCVRGLQ